MHGKQAGPARVSESNRGRRIAIVIVAYNAVSTLAQVLARIPAHVWDNVAEVIVLDDASGDATYELAAGYKLIRNAEKLRVVKNERNLRYGGNQKAGYRYCIENGFDAVVLLHGDGQYAPEMLHHLYAPIVEGRADAVFGTRMNRDFGGPLKGGMPLYKYLGNRILTKIENRALGMNLSEFHSGYRAYNVHALEKISMDEMTDDFHFDTEIIIKLNHQGFRIAEVPIPTFYGQELCNVDGLKYAFDVVRAVRRYRSTVRSARCFPEFREYFSNYPLKDNAYSSHGAARALVGTQQRVLDVGCGEGYLASMLRTDRNEVCGIDILPAPAQREAFSSYVCADLNEGLRPLRNGLSPQTFDKILLLDVLQQLIDPAALLRELPPLLKPHGEIVVSLPNVANITVRAALAFGAFAYSDRGILDRRHLHFFTRKTARALIEENGYTILAERATTMPLEFVLDLNPKGIAARAFTRALAFFTALFPRLLGYQWVFAARPRI